MSKNDSLMVVGTLYRKAPSRKHLKATEADVVRKDMKVSRSYADEINEDETTLNEFVIDDAKTERYYKDVEVQKKQMLANRQREEMASTDVARQLINMASGVIPKTEKVKEEPTKNDSSKDAAKEHRAELFEEANELGLKVAKNIKTDKLEEVINAAKSADKED